MRTYQVEIKETLCMTVEIEAKTWNRLRQWYEWHTRTRITFLMQSILPAWILPHRKKKWMLETKRKSTVGRSDNFPPFLFRLVVFGNNRHPLTTQDRCLVLQQALNLDSQIRLLGAFAPNTPYASLYFNSRIEVFIMKDVALLRPARKELER